MNSIDVLKPFPVIFLAVDSQLCNFRIELNGVRVFNWDEGIPIATSLAVNQWIVAGDNKLEVIVRKLDDETSLLKAECKVKLLLGENNQHILEAHTVTDLYVKNGVNCSVKEDVASDITTTQVDFIDTKDHEFLLKRFVQLPQIFPMWKWQTSDVIADTDVVRKSLYREYQLIWKMFSNKNYSKIKSCIGERLQELAKACYMTTEEMFQRGQYKQVLEDPDTELYPLDDDFEFELMAEGRLARISRWDLESQIALTDKDQTSTVLYDFIFRYENGVWIVTR